MKGTPSSRPCSPRAALGLAVAALHGGPWGGHAGGPPRAAGPGGPGSRRTGRGEHRASPSRPLPAHRQAVRGAAARRPGTAPGPDGPAGGRGGARRHRGDRGRAAGRARGTRRAELRHAGGRPTRGRRRPRGRGRGRPLRGVAGRRSWWDGPRARRAEGTGGAPPQTVTPDVGAPVGCRETGVVGRFAANAGRPGGLPRLPGVASGTDRGATVVVGPRVAGGVLVPGGAHEQSEPRRAARTRRSGAPLATCRAIRAAPAAATAGDPEPRGTGGSARHGADRQKRKSVSCRVLVAPAVAAALIVTLPGPAVGAQGREIGTGRQGGAAAGQPSAELPGARVRGPPRVDELPGRRPAFGAADVRRKSAAST